MMTHETREIIEDVANLVALQVVRPIENRLTALETKVQCQSEGSKTKVETKWKIVGFCLAVPGFFGAAISLLKIL